LTEIRNSISAWLDQADAIPIIKNLTFAQCSYLQSVFKLETLRVVNSPCSSSYQQIFQYLEDKAVEKDKAGIWYCIFCMAKKTFYTYLEVVHNQLAKTPERDKDLECMAQFLLVKFNHINKKLRPLADHLLAKLMEAFPYLLWSEKTLRCIMDLTDLLATSLNMDANQVAPEFDVPYTNLKLKILDTLEGRESTCSDFTQRCLSIIQETLEFAPITAKSHIQNYMLHLQLKGENIYNHSGVSMVLDCLMKYSKPKSNIESLDSTSLSRRPDCIKKDFGSFISQMNERYNYVGVVQGLMKVMNMNALVKMLIYEMRAAASKTRDEKKLKEAMLKSAAFLTIQSTTVNNAQKVISYERELLHEINVSVCYLFHAQIIQCAIDCWSWIISSRPELEPLVVEEMLNAWQMSVDLRLGMFSAQVHEPHPLAKEEQDVLKPDPPPNLNTHRVWIKYLQERLEIAKYKSEFETELFFNLMHKSLAFLTYTDAGNSQMDDSMLNRHVSCVGLRFRFLNMALSIVQYSSSLTNTIAKWILRERIYYTGLDYFTVRFRAPTQNSLELRDDIKYVLEFWNKIVAEKKYLKNESTNFMNSNLNGNISTSNNGVNTGGSGTPDANSMSGVDPSPSNGNINMGGQTLNPALGTSITYTSASGIPNLNTPSGLNNGLNTTMIGDLNVNNVTSNNGTISQLVTSSGLFLDPNLAVTTIGKFISLNLN
jgi:phosphatidylinositol 4-kinase